MKLYTIISYVLSLAILACAGFHGGADCHLPSVSPALASKSPHALLYKAIADNYGPLFAVLDVYCGQKLAKSCTLTEEQLEELVSHLKKTEGYQSLDGFMHALALDIQVLERWQQISLADAKDAAWLHAGGIQALINNLVRLQKVLSEHRVLLHAYDMHSYVRGVFARELSLYTSKQMVTLASYMRSSRKQYATDLALWIERIKLLRNDSFVANNGVGQELAVLLRGLEGLKKQIDLA